MRLSNPNPQCNIVSPVRIFLPVPLSLCRILTPLPVLHPPSFPTFNPSFSMSTRTPLTRRTTAQVPAAVVTRTVRIPVRCAENTRPDPLGRCAGKPAECKHRAAASILMRPIIVRDVEGKLRFCYCSSRNKNIYTRLVSSGVHYVSCKFMFKVTRDGWHVTT